MLKNLETRLGKLEAAYASEAPPLATWITFAFVVPRSIPGELRGYHIGSLAGSYFAKETNETEDDFLKRIRPLIPENQYGAYLLLEDREWIPDPAQALDDDTPRSQARPQRIAPAPTPAPKGNRMLPGNGVSLDILRT
jgi:hypothetical protein